jgi:hypothetical protein
VFVGGYAGELITNRTVVLAFAPDRVAARPPSVARRTPLMRVGA